MSKDVPEVLQDLPSVNAGVLGGPTITVSTIELIYQVRPATCIRPAACRFYWTRVSFVVCSIISIGCAQPYIHQQAVHGCCSDWWCVLCAAKSKKLDGWVLFDCAGQVRPRRQEEVARGERAVSAARTHR